MASLPLVLIGGIVDFAVVLNSACDVVVDVVIIDVVVVSISLLVSRDVVDTGVVDDFTVVFGVVLSTDDVVISGEVIICLDVVVS